MCVSAGTGIYMYMYMHCGFEFHLRQLIFLRKNDCLGRAVLLCLVVCLTFLPSFSSLIKTCKCIHVYMYMYIICTCSI